MDRVVMLFLARILIFLTAVSAGFLAEKLRLGIFAPQPAPTANSLVCDRPATQNVLASVGGQPLAFETLSTETRSQFLATFQSEGECPPVVAAPGEGVPGMGSPSAPIRIVFYGDLRCLECRQVWPRLYTAIKQQLSQTQLVAIPRWNNHPEINTELGKVSYCASLEGEDALYATWDALYRIPLELTRTPQRFAAFVQTNIVPQIKGATQESFRTCLSTEAAGKAALATSDYAAGLPTPATLWMTVNGHYVDWPKDDAEGIAGFARLYL